MYRKSLVIIDFEIREALKLLLEHAELFSEEFIREIKDKIAFIETRIENNGGACGVIL